MVPFDGDFASRSPQEFIDHVLVEQLGAERVSVGENFRFGHRAKGDVALLRAQDAFETRVVELVQVEGEIVSSTQIRGLVEAGEMERAAAYLGSHFQLRGPVAHGDKRGRTLGLPDGEPRARPGARLSRPRRLRVPRGGRGRRRVELVAGGDQRRRAAHVRDAAAGCSSRRSCSASTASSTATSCGSSSSSGCAGSCASSPSTELVEQMQRDVEDTRRIATLPVADDDHR